MRTTVPPGPVSVLAIILSAPLVYSVMAAKARHRAKVADAASEKVSPRRKSDRQTKSSYTYFSFLGFFNPSFHAF